MTKRGRVTKAPPFEGQRLVFGQHVMCEFCSGSGKRKKPSGERYPCAECSGTGFRNRGMTPDAMGTDDRPA